MTPFGLIKYAAILLTAIAPLFAQSPPVSSAQPWHSVQERQVAPGPRSTYSTLARIEPDKIYSLAELIDFAEAHNPETRVAWENARASRGSRSRKKRVVSDRGRRGVGIGATEDGWLRLPVLPADGDRSRDSTAEARLRVSPV
jgi:hypothetical protein